MKHLKKQSAKLEKRRKAYDSLSSKDKLARKRPGSMNPHKQK